MATSGSKMFTFKEINDVEMNQLLDTNGFLHK